MALSGLQYQQLQTALLRAFVDEDNLQQFVQIHLDESLPAIVGSGALATVVFKLIGWMESRGRLDDLLKGALTARPRSSELRTFVATHFPAWLPPPTPILAYTIPTGTLMETVMDRPLSRMDQIKRTALQQHLDLLADQYTALLDSQRLEGDRARKVLLEAQQHSLETEIRKAEAQLAELGGPSAGPIARTVAPVPPDVSPTVAPKSPQSPLPPARDQVFISYSHADKRWLDQLLEQLAPLKRQGKVKVWSDTDLKPGIEWEKEIAAGLAATKVAVLLVSPSFLASPFIAEKEVPPLLEAAAKDGVTIFWIAVRASNYRETTIAKYQAANDPAHPLNTLSPARRDQAWVAISRKLLAAFN